MTRTRYDTRSFKNGTWKRFGNTFGGNQVLWEESTCVDSPGKGLGDNLAFTVDHIYLQGGKINQKVKDGGSYFTAYFDDYTADTFTFSGKPQFPLITSYPGEKSTSLYAGEALARTCPNHPIVDCVQNVGEAGDIPRSLIHRGETLLKLIGSETLRLEFGIRPLLKDIKKTIDFADGVHKRLQQLQKFRDFGGFRKTVTLDELSNSQWNNNITLQSSGAFFTDSFETIGHRKIRGHVRWLPQADFKKFTQREMLAMAKRAYFGLEFSFSGYWEAMPWSWFIDWYSNLGNMLELSRNTVPCTLQSITIMRETSSESVTHKQDDGVRVISPGIVTKVRKERYPGSATLDVQLPILSGEQMGILAALLVTKSKHPF